MREEEKEGEGARTVREESREDQEIAEDEDEDELEEERARSHRSAILDVLRVGEAGRRRALGSDRPCGRGRWERIMYGGGLGRGSFWASSEAISG